MMTMSSSIDDGIIVIVSGVSGGNKEETSEG
jgi:hypothetical protein